jgi:hypothetical protein
MESFILGSKCWTFGSLDMEWPQYWTPIYIFRLPKGWKSKAWVPSKTAVYFKDVVHWTENYLCFFCFSGVKGFVCRLYSCGRCESRELSNATVRQGIVGAGLVLLMVTWN